jgi:ParB-like chromosome segregation protein Spo0J
MTNLPITTTTPKTEETKSQPMMKQPTIPIHPIATIFPRPSDEVIDAMALDIKARNQQQPAVVFEDMILDGVTRQEACKRAGVEVWVVPYRGDDPIGFVLSANLHRRHLNTGQRAVVAASLADLERGANQTTKGSGTSIEVAAKLLNVGRASVERARIVLNSGCSELVEAVKSGTSSVSAATKMVKKKSKTATPTSTNLSDKADELLDKLIEVLGKMKPKQQAITASNIIDRIKQEGFFTDEEVEEEEEEAEAA